MNDIRYTNRMIVIPLTFSDEHCSLRNNICSSASPCRRLLRISWTQHKTNEWILGKLKVERELLDRVKSLNLGFYGHTTRKYECLKKVVYQATELVDVNAGVGQMTSPNGLR